MSDMPGRRRGMTAAAGGGGTAFSRAFSSSYGKVRERKAFAVLAVAVLLAVCVIPMIPYEGSSASSGGYTQTVVYHSSAPNSVVEYNPVYNQGPTGAYDDVTVTYHGDIIATEYNPQVWAGSFKDSSGKDAVNWYPITAEGYSKEGRARNHTSSGTCGTLVFTGWAYATSTGYTDARFPGEVMSENEIENAKDAAGKIHVYATWGRMVNFVDSLSEVGLKDSEGDQGDLWRRGGNQFTNIVLVTGKTVYLNDANTNNENRSGFTLRGWYDGFNGDMGCVVVGDSQGGNNYIQKSNMLIDNVYLDGDSGKVDHGDTGYGIIANSFVLVMGTRVIPYIETQVEVTPNLSNYVQVFGGSTNGDAGKRDEVKRDMYGDGKGDTLTVSTMLIFHSGKWANIVGGTNSSGTANVGANVYVSVKEAEVLDTLLGGSSGTPWGDSTYGPRNIQGSVFVYATGLTMRGDDYVERYLGTPVGSMVPALDKPTLLAGGCNVMSVIGDTHIFLSGDSSVWDVSGGGRRAKSTVTGAHIEVSGNARVNHILCGSIADGISGKPTAPGVKSTHIVIKQEAVVASVFGAGYDMHSSPDYPSMYGSGSSIDVDITGGTVGYVYGGGYRGNVGYQGQPVDSVDITVSGGRVLGDVFGGGRGGLDKLNHMSTGHQGGTGLSDSTGRSAVFAKKVSVSITGGEVLGSVYGGGESVPVVEFN